MEKKLEITTKQKTIVFISALLLLSVSLYRNFIGDAPNWFDIAWFLACIMFVCYFIKIGGRQLFLKKDNSPK